MDEQEKQKEALAVAKAELEAQRERGEWSGLISTSGSPIYTLAEIVNAVAKRMHG